MSFLYPSRRTHWWEVAVCAVIVGLAVSFSRRPDSQAAAVARADSVAFVLAEAYRAQRVVTDSVTRRATTAEWHVTTERRRLRGSADSLRSALTASRDVLADSLADASTLRTTLQGLTEVAAIHMARADTLTMRVDSLLIRHAAERREWLLERSAADSLLAAKDSVIVALRPSCRLLGPIPCPSRKASFVVGVVAGLGAVVLARQAIP